MLLWIVPRFGNIIYNGITRLFVESFRGKYKETMC